MGRAATDGSCQQDDPLRAAEDRLVAPRAQTTTGAGQPPLALANTSVGMLHLRRVSDLEAYHTAPGRLANVSIGPSTLLRLRMVFPRVGLPEWPVWAPSRHWLSCVRWQAPEPVRQKWRPILPKDRRARRTKACLRLLSAADRLQGRASSHRPEFGAEN